jgi:hypothetical protein
MSNQTLIFSNCTVLIISDHVEREQSTQWLEFEIKEKVHPDLPLSESRARFLQAALALISAEIDATTRRLSRKP